MPSYRITEQDRGHFITCTVVNWIDIFTRQAYRDIVIESLKHCQKEKGLIIYGYVIMSNHLHMIASCENNLSDVIRDFKKFTSKKIIEVIANGNESRKDWILFMFERAAKRHSRNTKYQLWVHDNHPEELWSHEFTLQKLKYIHNNPVRAGIVEKPEDYLYSSARNYAELESLLEVERISLYSYR